MRALSLLGVAKFAGTDPDATVLLVKAQQVDHLAADASLPRACILTLSHNLLHDGALRSLWEKFPCAWWVDLEKNQLRSLAAQYPLALGKLNLAGNPIDLASLSSLDRVHILRLHLTVGAEMGASLNSYIAGLLPNVWVVNDDFISAADRAARYG
jgi:hypothetical protein